MKFEAFEGIIIPFVGTVLGACSVFLLKSEIKQGVKAILSGFAGGVMLAASVWSLIIPSIESSSALGSFAFVPAVVGFILGVCSILALDKAIPSRA